MLTGIKQSGEIREFQELFSALREGHTPVSVSGAGDIQKAQLTAAVYQETGRPVLLICAEEGECERLRRDIEEISTLQAHLLTSREFTFYPAVSVSRQMEQSRINTLFAMAENRAPILLATADALMQRCIPKDALLGAVEKIAIGESYDLHTLLERFTEAGYRRCEQVEGPGQFALRGGILDVFSPAQNAPVRVEFWGDTIDSMALFDTDTQRRTEEISKAVILPTAETLFDLHPGGRPGMIAKLEKLIERIARRKNPQENLLQQLRADLDHLQHNLTFSWADKYMALLYNSFTSPIDYLPQNCTLLLSEMGRVADRGKAYLTQHREDMKMVLETGAMDGSQVDFIKPWPEVFGRLLKWPFVAMNQFSASARGLDFTPKTLINLLTKQLPSYGGSMETAEGDVRHYVQAGYSTIVLCGDERRAKRLAERLQEADIPLQLTLDPAKAVPKPGTCLVTIGNLSAGVEYPGAKIAIITEGQIIQAPPSTKTPKAGRRRSGQRLERYTDLSPGDLVVHEHHGIGRFVAILPMDVDGLKKDYIKIAYRGTDSLYVPVTQLDLVSKYIGTGGEEQAVRLSKLGGADWTRMRTKAKGAAKDLARGLIALYAARQREQGFAFSPDSAWQREFEEAFDYTETGDQLVCTEEIKHDMMKPAPMDRLLCGDVGYGKTEVAFRAVMKCILDGKQAAILVPTTVLAQQHYQTAQRRFSGYPVTISVLSRFQSAAQGKKIEAEIEKGGVDLVIGTHKILQKRIVFKDLGLLIVDEEQRFGVSHKERLKEMSKSVDVLTLSATPIPRTLNMALSGIRDMSTIEEPPLNRQPIQTYVMEHDWDLLADAMRREVARGGQVYYLRNRVEDMERVARNIKERLPHVQVAVAHGQMDENLLDRAMESMVSGRCQILVCTTIIETGIDIPNVNTLIIEDADRLGLAQLHQIRGRVGRSSRSAFAYLTYRPGKALTEVATKRLSAIREFVEFNSGFKIALRDLEIRGAGNILGAEQSGHMASVGYDMYLKLLNEAVLEEKGEAPPIRAECAADLAVDAGIPADYVALPEARMDLYRRIAHIREEEDAQDVIDELIDRYGNPPERVLALIRVAKLRGLAAKVGITEIAQKGGHLQFSFLPAAFFLEDISAVYAQKGFFGRIKILAGDIPAVRVKLAGEMQALDQVAAFVGAYGETKNKREKTEDETR